MELIENLPSADNEVVGKLKTAIESEELCKSCPTAKRISGENLLGAMALGFSYGINANRPQAYWINDNGAFRCSVCGEREDAFIDGWDWEVCGASKFCPSCGARMKGADDETTYDQSKQ